MFQKLSLETKYICSTMFVVLFVVVINLALYMHGYDAYSNSLTQQITNNSQEKTESYVKQKGLVYAELLSKQLFDPLYTDNISQAYEQIKATLSQPDVSKIHVVDNEGLIFHDGTTQLRMFAQPHYRSPFILKAIEESRTLVSFSKHQLEIAAPIQQSNITLGGAVYLELNLIHLLEEKEQNIEQVQAITSNDKQKMFNLLLTISGISVLFGSIIAYALGRSLTKPLKQLKDQFSESNTQALPVTDIQSKDEVGELISAYNKMSNKVNRYTSRVEFMAYHDILTSLPNREKLLIDIQTQITDHKSPPSLAVVFIDLDDFKHINDNYGHNIGGDKLLGHLASELQARLPSYFKPLYRLSTIVSRVGADEFVLAFPCSDNHEAREKANDIHRQLLSPFSLEENDIQITASLGIAVYPEFGSNAESLLQLSSLAAQESKRRGKDIMTIYDSTFDETIKQRLYIERELRRSVRDLSQFELWYQHNLINLSPNWGVEALVRWNHPEKGYISPESFIPIAEQSDLILELGEHIIETAVAQRAMWAEHFGTDFHIALNLSPKTNLSPRFKSIIFVFTTTCRPPQTIHVEVTESLFIDDTEKAQYVLKKLQSIGVEVWLDDFGTGYSALAYLQHMAFDGLKIDRSFIAQIRKSDQDDSLVRAIVSMAHNLRMKVVAEGVETQTQLTRMESLHCDIVQGFFLGRPVPAEELIAFEYQRGSGAQNVNHFA
ncbi:LOW QUALITY PROTEIN: diguanylate cyclase/phosphodiesterase [Vibrio sp. JCM 18904]|nr:LOW QUALITY PROTEIN: diguanylate cyclase/phosphodiesterase [Vibrio sp. JCM 18904]